VSTYPPIITTDERGLKVILHTRNPCELMSQLGQKPPLRHSASKTRANALVVLRCARETNLCAAFARQKASRHFN